MDSGGAVLGEPLPIELMNTIWADRDGLHDSLEDLTTAASWLRDRTGIDPADDPITDRIVVEFRRLRDALRALAARATADPRPIAASTTPDFTRAVAVVNRASAHASMWSELVWTDGSEPVRMTRSKRTPAEVVRSTIAEQAVQLFAGPDRVELRACVAPGCVRYFLRDHPRREWCSAACGNRARVARHYQRHHGPRHHGPRHHGPRHEATPSSDDLSPAR